MEILTRFGLNGRRFQVMLVCGLLAVTTWFARYSESTDFGLYVDDVWRVTSSIEAGVGGSLVAALRGFRHPSGPQGRPLHDASIFLLSSVGYSLGGLRAIYLLGYLIVAANGCLFYLLLRRLAAPDAVSVPAALAYTLFPADTTQAWLTIALGAQPCVTTLLLAFHCYLSRRHTAAYLFCILTLGWYETVFPVFLAAPLLTRARHRWRWRVWLRHASIMAAALATVFALRLFAGEQRVAELDLPTAVTWPVRQMAIGSVVAMGTYFHRPFSALRALPAESIPGLALCFSVFAWLLYRMRLPAPSTLRARAHLRRLGRLGLIGATWLALAYAFAFTIPAESGVSFFSRVHLPAVVGASLLFGCLCFAALSFANATPLRLAVVAASALLYAGLIAFGWQVQRDYRLAWQYQQAFWTDVVRLCPDRDGGQVILYERDRFRQPVHMAAFAWSASQVPGFLYRYPSATPVLACPLGRDWRSILSLTGDIRDALDMSQTVWRDLDRIPEPEFIFLEVEDGHLVRPGGTLGAGPSPLPKRWLYGLLILSPDEEPADYIR